MVDGAREGKQVVRLKSGDPGIFGRLNEELAALHAAKISFEIVPGVTAANAAAASIGVSLTDRDKSSRVIFVSGHQAGSKGVPSEPDWSSLAQSNATIVVYMPGSGLRHLGRKLIAAGLAPETSSVVVAQASTAHQKQFWVTVGTLGDLDSSASPSIVLIGRALDLAASRAAIENLSGDQRLEAFSPAQLERRIAS
jgi:uroporphyrin-III C-methyltransferase/precorrin-2 dehydrogenase/sirohydrochlorin ferrochelatase